MALAYLLILFIAMIVISIILISLLYLSQNERFKNIIFYILVLWSLVVTFISFTSLPSNFLLERIISLLLGSLSIISIFTKAKTTNLAYLLATASTVLGLIYLLVF